VIKRKPYRQASGVSSDACGIAGRGIGLMFVLSAVTGIVVTLFVYANPHIRNVEDELPDALPAEPKEPN